MNGRMNEVENNVFFLCSLIDYIARKTKNRRSVIVQKLGIKTVEHLYKLADVYHSENIDRVSDEFIRRCNISVGDFDNVSNCKYTVPSYFDMGKVYSRLVIGISNHEEIGISEAVMTAYRSYVSEKLDDYNSSFYYDSPQNILNAYIYGYIE